MQVENSLESVPGRPGPVCRTSQVKLSMYPASSLPLVHTALLALGSGACRHSFPHSSPPSLSSTPPAVAAAAAAPAAPLYGHPAAGVGGICDGICGILPGTSRLPFTRPHMRF
eukprot:1157779-Pelagomonas_calceolata.AAC.18